MSTRRPSTAWMTVLALASLLLAVSAFAQAKPDAKEILAKCDKLLGGNQDQYMETTMRITNERGAAKEYDFLTSQKGDTKRLVRFTSGEIKGLSTLIEGRNSMYVYLPGFKKIRPIAAHNMNQSFAGSDFSNEDMAIVTWGSVYDPVFDHEDDTYYYLKLTPKAGAAVSYASLILKIYKSNSTQGGVDYFNAAGEKIKYQLNSEYKTYPSGAKLNSYLVIGDPRTGHKTELFIKVYKVNQGISDSLFTQRELQWGK